MANPTNVLITGGSGMYTTAGSCLVVESICNRNHHAITHSSTHSNVHLMFDGSVGYLAQHLISRLLPLASSNEVGHLYVYVRRI